MMNRIGFRPSVAVVTVLRLICQFHTFSISSSGFGKKYGHPLDWMPILIHTPLREKEGSCSASRNQYGGRP
jgi:hypothetical protein